MLDFRTLWDKGLTFDAFVAASEKQKGLWEGLYRIARRARLGLGGSAGGRAAASCW